MELFRQIAAWTVMGVFTVFGLLVIGAIVRFSIISEWKGRGARKRLRMPDLEGVRNRFGVDLPDALSDFYHASPWIEKPHFELVKRGEEAKAYLFYIGEFIPLTVPDIKEWRKITGVDGIPIATDADKGVYHLPSKMPEDSASVPVLWARPGRKAMKITVVSQSIEEFASLVIAEDADEG